MTRYNLEVLGLCPCLVDIEIVDTRNGNESNLVTAGRDACACDDPGRKVGPRGGLWVMWRRGVRVGAAQQTLAMSS